MSINFEYLLKGQSQFLSKEFSPEEFFDLEEDEEIEIDSVPKFSQPYLYLNIKIEEILLVILVIAINNEKRIFKQTVWNNGNNILTERVDIGRENYKELILSVKIDEGTDLYETIRFFVGDNFTVPTYHSFIHSDENGKEVEKKIDTEVYIEMVRQGLI